jgi:hypothetical protein
MSEGMSNRFEKWNITTELMHSLRLREALDSHQEHRENIQNKLRAFLSVQEARETATRVCNLALDIDEDIGRILKDPLVGKLYEYDGQFFTPRGTRFFHTAFDGIHLLQWLSGSSFEPFFRGRGKRGAIRWMLEELGRHAWVARVRRMNWEAFQTLGLVPQEVLDAIVNGARERRRESNPPGCLPKNKVSSSLSRSKWKDRDETPTRVAICGPASGTR